MSIYLITLYLQGYLSAPTSIYYILPRNNILSICFTPLPRVRTRIRHFGVVEVRTENFYEILHYISIHALCNQVQGVEGLVGRKYDFVGYGGRGLERYTLNLRALNCCLTLKFCVCFQKYIVTSQEKKMV